MGEKKKEDNFFEHEKVIGLVLSMLFGLVFKDIISSYDKQYENFKKLLISITNQDTELEILFVVFIFIFYMDIFRMLHGFIITLYDKRNPSNFGPYPYNFLELMFLGIIFTSPLIANHLLMHTELFVIYIFAYQFPNLVYLVYDIKLRKELDVKKVKSEYDNYLTRWIKFDAIYWFFTIIVLCSEFSKFASNNFLFTISMLAFFKIIMLLLDYIHYNRTFYFPVNKQ